MRPGHRKFNDRPGKHDPKLPTYNILTTGYSNSIIINIGKQKRRALLDSGSHVNLIRFDVYKDLKDKPRLENKKANLQSVDGNLLNVLGRINLKFNVKTEVIEQDFYVVKDMNRAVILGQSFLQDNLCRIYFDLGCVRVRGVMTPLLDDERIAAVIRLKTRANLKPYSSTICTGKIKSYAPLSGNNHYVLTQGNKSSFMNNRPELSIIDTVVNLDKRREVQIMIVNDSGQHLSIRPGVTVGQLENCDLIQTVNNVNEKTIDGKKSFEEVKSLINAPEDKKQMIAELLYKNYDIMAFSESELKETDLVQMRIETLDDKPVKLRPYRTPLNDQKIVDEAIKKLVTAGIIQRSRSPYAAPFLLVGKKDGSKRLVVDYRQLNAKTKGYSFPLPLIDSVFQRLGGSSYFSTIDLYAGFHCIPIHPDDREKTAFGSEHVGLYEWRRSPFGLKNSPAYFCEMMSRALEGLEYCAIPFVDDVIIFSKTLEDHLRHLQLVFDKFRQHSLRIKLSKCQFLKAETDHLGFILSKDGIKPCKKKTEAIRNLAPPTSTKLVRSFLATLGYYRRFIEGFSEIAEPLFKLTKKHARFKWDDQCQKAFTILRNKLAEAPLLVYPDMSKRFLLYCDASNLSTGNILVQEFEDENGKIVERPLAFLSHKLNGTQQRYAILELECLAIIQGLQKFHSYLHGAETIVLTDHKPLIYMLEKGQFNNRKIARWILTIQSYNCKIVYVKGKNNVSDIMSRAPEGSAQDNQYGNEPEFEISDRSLEVKTADQVETVDSNCKLNSVNENDSKIKVANGNDPVHEVNMIDTSHLKPLELLHATYPITEELGKPQLEGFDMITEQNKDGEITTIMKKLSEGKADKTTEKHLIVVDSLLYYISNVSDDPYLRLYIPNHLTEHVIGHYHNYSHCGVQKTVDTIKTKYYFPGLYKRVYEYVQKCVPCQERSAATVNPPMGEHEVNNYPFSKIAGDIQGPFPTSSSGNKYVYTVICCYTGYLEAFAVPDKTADTIIHILLNEIFPRHSTPLVYLSDNGKENTDKRVERALNYLNVKTIRTSFYNPRGNCLVESSHKALSNLLSKKLEKNQLHWDLYLNQSVSAINFTVNTATQRSPFFLLYLRHPTYPLDNILQVRNKYLGNDPVEMCLQEQHVAFTRIYHRMKRLKRERNQKINKDRKDTDYTVGQTVYLRNHQKKNKLDARWKAFHVITEIKSPHTVVIKNQLDNTVRTTHVRHIRPASLDSWEIPKDVRGRPVRKAVYPVTPENSDSGTENSDSENEGNEPLAKVIKMNRKARRNSSDEDDIPLHELAKRLKERNRRIKEENMSGSNDSYDSEQCSSDDSIPMNNAESSDERTQSYSHDSYPMQQSSDNDSVAVSDDDNSEIDNDGASMQIDTVTKLKKNKSAKTSQVKNLLRALSAIID